jgi:hypothetical protein
MKRALQWPLFVVSIVLMGLAFLFSPFRKDEHRFFADNFGLDTHHGDGEGDSVEEAFAHIGKDGRWLHSLKNILHEWTREDPKRAAKFLSFLVVIEALIIIKDML